MDGSNTKHSVLLIFTGESLLHILIICDTLVHTRIARILLKCYPRMAIDMIEGAEYLGEAHRKSFWKNYAIEILLSLYY